MRKGQRGQALAELALIAPLILLLVLGILQIAVLALASLFVKNAAQYAARVYTVRYGLGAEDALLKARRAAESVLHRFNKNLRCQVYAKEGDKKSSALWSIWNQDFLGKGPSYFQVNVSTSIPLFFPLPRHLRKFEMSAESFTYSEATREFEASVEAEE